MRVRVKENKVKENINDVILFVLSFNVISFQWRRNFINILKFEGVLKAPLLHKIPYFVSVNNLSEKWWPLSSLLSKIWIFIAMIIIYDKSKQAKQFIYIYILVSEPNFPMNDDGDLAPASNKFIACFSFHWGVKTMLQRIL